MRTINLIKTAGIAVLALGAGFSFCSKAEANIDPQRVHISTLSSVGADPDIEGSLVVWVENRTIVGMDLKTKRRYTINNTPGLIKDSPTIEGRRIYWSAIAEWPTNPPQSPKPPYKDIYYCDLDLSTGACPATRLTVDAQHDESESDAQNGALAYNLNCSTSSSWGGHNCTPQIVLEKRVNSTYAQTVLGPADTAWNAPSTDGSHVAWASSGNADGRVRLYKIAAERQMEITDSGEILPFDPARPSTRKRSIPSISNQWIVWTEKLPNSPNLRRDNLFALNIYQPGKLLQLTKYTTSTPYGYSLYLDVDGSLSAWTFGKVDNLPGGPSTVLYYISDIYLYNLSGFDAASTPLNITNDLTKSRSNVKVSGNRVVYIEHSGSGSRTLQLAEITPLAHVRAGETSYAVSEQWTKVSFVDALPNTSLSVLAQISTTAGDDTAAARVRNISGTGFQVKAEEEQSYSDELVHNKEKVAFLAMLTGPIRNASGQIIGEAGLISNKQASKYEWFMQTLRNTYSKPVVFMQLSSHEEAEPAHMRVRSVTGSSFQYQIEEWDYLDGVHKQEMISYVVLEAGTHQLVDGWRIEVGVLPVSSVPRALTFKSLSGIPAVISHVQTNNDSHAVVTRQNQTASGVMISLQEQERRRKSGKLHPEEMVGFLGIQK